MRPRQRFLSDFAIQRVFTNEQEMSESRKLLKEYASSRSEPPFRELVERYVNLVHSAAVRLASGDTHLAEDVTQIVFADLAAMAPKLPQGVLLGGWLHQHTCFVTNRTLRTERRRRIRERQAAEMNSQQDHTEANLARIAPILDEAIGRLGTSDRTAIILRYFEQYDLRSVGEALGTTEDAAQKRMDRALEKLHVLLKHRGATLSAAALGTALATEAVTAAPAGLAGSVAGAALAAAGGGTATGLKLLLSKLSGLSRAQTSFLCLAIAAGPVTWEWNVKRACLARAALAQSQLEVVREEAGQSAADLAQLRAEFARLDTAVAEAEKDSARYAEAARKLELLKEQVRGLLVGIASPWSTNQPYVRFPKATIKSLDPQHRPMAGFSELALEIYGITEAEKSPESVTKAQVPTIAASASAVTAPAPGAAGVDPFWAGCCRAGWWVLIGAFVVNVGCSFGAVVSGFRVKNTEEALKSLQDCAEGALANSQMLPAVPIPASPAGGGAPSAPNPGG